MSAHQAMYVVGVIEVLAGVLVAVHPRLGAAVVAAWLGGIIINLLLIPGYYDVALRDFGLLLGAVALQRLATRFDPGRLCGRCGRREQNCRSTAFVMTGGGSLGAVQVGMATALHEHGIDPDVLVGTSVGAVNAAYLAGPGTTGQAAIAGRLWSGMRRRDLFSIQPRRWVRATPGRCRRCSPATRCDYSWNATWATTRSRTPGFRCTSRPPTSSPVTA